MFFLNFFVFCGYFEKFYCFCEFQIETIMFFYTLNLIVEKNNKIRSSLKITQLSS